MNRRKLRPSLDHHEVRRLEQALGEARRQSHPLNTHITVHPGRMDTPPDDCGDFFRRRVRNHIATWLERHGCPWWCVWVRENYEGDGEEHIHLIAHVPTKLQPNLYEALQRWFPGEGAVDLKAAYNPQGLLGYIIKQMTTQAHFGAKSRFETRRRYSGRASDNRPPRRETENRHNGKLVAPVLGKRSGMSKSLQRFVV